TNGRLLWIVDKKTAVALIGNRYFRNKTGHSLPGGRIQMNKRSIDFSRKEHLRHLNLYRLTRLIALLVGGFTALSVTGCSASGQSKKGNEPMFQLTSSAFETESTIPSQFSCDGSNISPELSWSRPPAGTKSLVLIMHDPDAPIEGGYTHWL